MGTGHKSNRVHGDDVRERPVVNCQYCQNPAVLVGGVVIYPHRPDLAAKRFWYCSGCQAWVGCHRGTDRRLGHLADANDRALKSGAHFNFDKLWRDGHMTRKAAYNWLADQMDMKRGTCHIGWMKTAELKKVIELCGPQMLCHLFQKEEAPH